MSLGAGSLLSPMLKSVAGDHLAVFQWCPNSSSILPSRDHRFLHGLVAVIIFPQARQSSHSPHHKTLFHYGNPFWQAPQPDPQLAQFSVCAVMKPRTVWETKTLSPPSASLYCIRVSNCCQEGILQETHGENGSQESAITGVLVP